MRIADTDSACGSPFAELKRRWCWHPGQILALCRTTALQCGHIRVAPKPPARAAAMLAAAAHQAGLNLYLLVLPTEFDVPAHARAGRDRNRSCLHVTDDNPPFQNIDSFGGF